MVRGRRPLEGALVLDLFAGSGALGIEALSQGAASVTFVEHDAEAVRAIRSNLASTGLEEAEGAEDAEHGGRVRVVRSDVLRWLGDHGGERFDVALCDPPYSFDGWHDLLEVLPAELVVIESDRELAIGPDWEVLKAKRYGGTVVILARRFPDRVKGLR